MSRLSGAVDILIIAQTISWLAGVSTALIRTCARRPRRKHACPQDDGSPPLHCNSASVAARVSGPAQVVLMRPPSMM
jgi:hypothetical protein